MGRTLHYRIQHKSFVPSDEQQYALYHLADRYAEMIEWTAERPTFDYYEYNPAWDKLKMVLGFNTETDNLREYVDEEFKKKRFKGMSHLNTLRSLHKAGLIQFVHEASIQDPDGKTISFDYFAGFTKVSGNELNAHAVIRFIIEASQILPDQTIVLTDEGDALYCPLLIQNGCAKPNKERIRKELSYWLGKTELHKGDELDVTVKEQYYNNILSKRLSFSDPNQFIRPIKTTAYLNDRNQFKIQTLSMVNAKSGLRNTIAGFLENEQKESDAYYDDVKSFPCN